MADFNLHLIFCEGSHDIAFLFKLLRFQKGVEVYSKKIKEFPKPLKDYLLGKIDEFDFNSSNIFQFPLMPKRILKVRKNLLIFFPLGGDSGKQAKIIINDLSHVFKINIDDYDGSLSFSTFLDADKKGVNQRLEEIKKDFFEIDVDNLENASVVSVDNILYGSYIFRNESNTGKLEDIILPLMEDENNEIFDGASKFLDDYFNPDRVKRKHYKEKSIIGIAGQLQISGFSNSSIIENTDYLNEGKIAKDKICNDILSFFKKLIPELK